YPTENVHILPVFGPAALAISPRIGHLHITVDDIIEPLRPDQVAKGLAYIHYRTENLQIAPVFGPDALKITPRVGHLHVRLDDAPWGWTYASGQPVIVNGLSPGRHRIQIELADANHQALAQNVVEFEVPQR